MRVLAVVAATTITLISLACGSGNSIPPSSPTGSDAASQGEFIRVLLEFDTSSLPPELNAETAIGFAENVMRDRILNFGGFSVSTVQGDSNRLSIEFQGITVGEATDLLGRRALLQFRQPVLDDSGRVVCSSSDGGQFTTEPAQITETLSEDGGMSAHCIGAEGVTGEVKWEPATAKIDGQTETLDIFSVREASYNEQDNVGPFVELDFTAEGSLLFKRVTERLVGYPLGIFVDERLIVAPTVQQPINSGKSVIQGLNFVEARILAAQVNAGWMLIPVRVISAEEVTA